MRVRSVDVAVVGAGPAGSAAAQRLAAHGLDVVLIDRHRFPRPKTCGDGLTPRALALIEGMGALDELRGFPSIDSLVSVDLVTEEATRSRLLHRRGDALRATTVPRTVLDDTLRRAAGRAGATLLDGVEVRSAHLEHGAVTGLHALSPAGPLRIDARVTVVAEGAAGRLSRLLGPSSHPRISGIAVRQYFVLSGTPEPAFRIYFPLPVAHTPLCGYGWLFPAGDGRANVGVGGFFGTRRVTRERVRAVFGAFVRRLRSIEPSMSTAVPCGAAEGGRIPSALRCGPFGMAGMVLVGDAVGAANFFTGEGISQALESGQAAADAILEHLGGGRPLLPGYSDRLRALFPQADHLGGWADWLAERARFRARECWGALTSESGLANSMFRSIVLEESAGEPDRLSESTRTVWDATLREVEAAHPLLATYLRAMETTASARMDRLCRPFAAAGVSSGLVVPMGLLAVAWILADDVQPSPAASTTVRGRGDWARNTLDVAAIDLLVARAFSSLAAVPTRHASAIAGLASRLFARRLADQPAGGWPHSTDDDFTVAFGELGAALSDGARGSQPTESESACAPV